MNQREPIPLLQCSKYEEYKRTRYSGIGRYKCPWPDCEYTPHFLRDLRRHMHKHTGDKRYKCDRPGCDFITVWKTSLLQHQRKKHDKTAGDSSPATKTNAYESSNDNTNETIVDNWIHVYLLFSPLLLLNFSFLGKSFFFVNKINSI